MTRKLVDLSVRYHGTWVPLMSDVIHYGIIDELVKSMGEHGLMLPIIVTHDGKVIDGSQRARAAKILGWTEIPCSDFEGCLGDCAYKPTLPREYRRHLKKMHKTLTIQEISVRTGLSMVKIQEYLKT